MSQAEDQAAKVLGPKINSTAPSDTNIHVVSVTTSSQAIQITGSGGALPRANGRIVQLNPEVDCYYAWGASGDSVDETATSGVTRCERLWSGQPKHEVPSAAYLIVKGSAAGKLRISIASP